MSQTLVCPFYRTLHQQFLVLTREVGISVQGFENKPKRTLY